MDNVIYKIWYKCKNPKDFDCLYPKVVFFQSDKQFESWKERRLAILKRTFIIQVFKRVKGTDNFERLLDF